MWIAQPKTHRHIVTLRYSPSENTPTTATVVQGRSDTPQIVTGTVAAVGVSPHG
jgi:hypothetical protein